MTGTLVTAAGHAGDKNPTGGAAARNRDLTLVHMHSSLVIAYLSLLVGLGAGLLAVRAAQPIMLRLVVLIGLVVAQGVVGSVHLHRCACGSGGLRWPERRRVRRPRPRYGRRCVAGRARAAFQS